MPGKVKVKIIAGKNLPVMDRSRETTDAYVEIKFGSTTYKTDVCKKTLNPQWNTDWYRFEVDDLELQDEPLQIRLMDYDTYSANDSIGKVNLNLNPLLLPSGSILPRLGISGDGGSSGEQVTNSVMSGWLPVYDTLHGIRGEVNVIVKVELFSDFNRFRQSSCGVQFFCSSVIPHGYYCQMINGFVEELIVNIDPEYQWIDKIRTPRSSNETRQTFFFKLSCELQRKIGLKAIELGGNAVIGYSQCFDLERETNVVVRGTGTAVTLIKLRHPLTVIPMDTNTEEQSLNYLNFLRYNKSFYLNRDNVSFKTLLTPATPSPFLRDSLTDVNDKSTLSKSNLSLNKSIININKQSSSLQNMLRQEDMRGTKGNMSRRIKSFSRFVALKPKLLDSDVEDDLKKNLFQKGRSSNPMAELLVHSLMRTSLDCITELHDTSSSSSVSPIQHTINERMTIINKSLLESDSDNQTLSTSSSNSSITERETEINGPPLANFDDFESEEEVNLVESKSRECPFNFANFNNTPLNLVLDEGKNNMHASLTHSLRTVGSPTSETVRHGHCHQRTESVGAKASQSPARYHPIPFMHRRSSDSDLSITPKGNSLTGSDKSFGLPTGYFSRVGPLLKSIGPQENFEMLEYPFLTISKVPPTFIVYLGGVVSARAVKLLGRVTNHDEPESRDTWWTEIRMEIRSHTRSLGCNAVLGYSESSTIWEDVCVISASGTAAVIDIRYTGEISDGISGIPFISKPYYNNKEVTTSLDKCESERDKTVQKSESAFPCTNITTKPLPESPENEPTTSFVPSSTQSSPCSMCHISYVGGTIPLGTITARCQICRMNKVPDVLLTTIEMPEGMPSVGRGCFVQAYVCRQLKELKGESAAKDLSDVLPFLEYELHRMLLNKLKVQGMNAVFGLQVRITFGAKTLIGIATGTGTFVSALPPPLLPKLVTDSPTDEKKLGEMQKLLCETVKLNKELYQLQINEDQQNVQTSPDEAIEDDTMHSNLFVGNRECCVLEIDDLDDMELENLLSDPRPPNGFHVVNTESVPGLDDLELVKNLQMFTQIWRAKLHHPFNLGKHIQTLLQSVYFKLRRMIPCALCHLKFRIDLPESDEIQLNVLGMALELIVPEKSKPKPKSVFKDNKKSDDDMIFNLEEDQVEASQPGPSYLSVQTIKSRGRSPLRLRTNLKNVQPRERHGIDITPLSYIPGGKIERYLSNLNFFFIRETTSLREEGGLSGFIHSFIMEVLAIIRAHMVALGGNAMVAYYMTECVLSHSLHKNQGQCLINVGGDVVFVSYFAEE